MTGFFFDEVRSFENIGNILKGFVDNYNKKILCSSSGNINIVSSIAHNLTGRYEIIQVYPLDFEEYLEDLDNDLFFQYKNLTPNLNWVFFTKIEKIFEEYMKFWAFPKILSLWYGFENEKIKILENILNSVKFYDLNILLKEKEKWKIYDVLKLLADKNSSVIKIDKLVQELWIKRHYIQHIIEAIYQVWLIIFLKPFFTQKKYELSWANKIYFMDVWIYQTILENYTLLWEKKWKVVENLVLLQILPNLEKYHIYFWRNKNQYEIDFILKNKFTNKLIPIEVKSSDSDNIPKIFKSFAKKYSTNIDYFVKITQTLEWQRQEILDWKKYIIKFVPLFKLPIFNF